MRLTTQSGPLFEVRADWLIIGVWEEEDPAASYGSLDTRLGGVLSRLHRKKDIEGKAGELTRLLNPTGVEAERLLIVGLGKRDKIDRAGIIAAAATATRSITAKHSARVAFGLPDGVPNLNSYEVTLVCGIGLMQGCYGPGIRKSEPTRFSPGELILVAPPTSNMEEVTKGVHRAQVEGQAVQLARELVNLPPCELYPESFADRARARAEVVGVQCDILDEERLKAERMGSLLGVAQGSDRPPRLVVLHYRHGTNGRTLGLVGKGVTFDSGGLSLKTSDQMVDMKCDMAGAAAVLAATGAIAELQIPVNVMGVLALVENMPSGRALKLGDVLHTRSGKTIEILNTDAEGRLILADALTYAVDLKANHLVDLATLTGACMVALGTEVAGVMGNDESWCERVLKASKAAGERAWPLPMFPHYGELIKSSVADMKNTGGTRYGGAIAAAKLLEQFVGKVPWAHLDIAGPAWVEHESAAHDVGGTGCFVRTLVSLALEYAKD